MPTKTTKSAAPTPSTAVATKKSANIVSIKEALKAQAEAMTDRTAPPSGNNIRLSPGQFDLPDGTKSPGPLELVIVDFVATNSFYDGPFDRNNPAPPVCFAVGANPLKLAPSPNSPQPQAKDCASCPMNQWNSGANGKGKACKNERKMAVLPPDGDESTPMWVLKASPTAIKSFDAHVLSVSRTFQAPPVAVVTKVGLDPNADYASLTFGDPTPNEQLPVHFARQAEAQTLLNTEPDFTQHSAPPPAGRGKPPVRRATTR